MPRATVVVENTFVDDLGSNCAVKLFPKLKHTPQCFDARAMAFQSAGNGVR